ncbi:MAG: hypothetical protein QM755_09215 [Luteolibacter sp.]
MNKVQYAVQLLSWLRKQKTPPLTRMTLCLAIASTGPTGAIASDIHKMTGDPEISSQLDNLVEGLDPVLRREKEIKGTERYRWRYFLTPAGEALAASVLNPQPPNASRV